MFSTSLKETNCHIVERAIGQETVGSIYLMRVALADSQQERGDLNCTTTRN